MAKPLEICMEKFISGKEYKLHEVPLKIKKEVVHKLEKYNEKLKAFYKDRGNKTTYPFIALLGKNKDGVVTKVVPIKGRFSNGCHLVPKLTTEQLSTALVKLIKQGFEPCGVLRVLSNTATERMGDFEISRQGISYNAVGDGFNEFFYKNKDFVNMTIVGKDNFTTIESITIDNKGKVNQYFHNIEVV